jgi:hypothetical protein
MVPAKITQAALNTVIDGMAGLAPDNAVVRPPEIDVIPETFFLLETAHQDTPETVHLLLALTRQINLDTRPHHMVAVAVDHKTGNLEAARDLQTSAMLFGGALRDTRDVDRSIHATLIEGMIAETITETDMKTTGEIVLDGMSIFVASRYE